MRWRDTVNGQDRSLQMQIVRFPFVDPLSACNKKPLSFRTAVFCVIETYLSPRAWAQWTMRRIMFWVKPISLSYQAISLTK